MCNRGLGIIMHSAPAPAVSGSAFGPVPRPKQANIQQLPPYIYAPWRHRRGERVLSLPELCALPLAAFTDWDEALAAALARVLLAALNTLCICVPTVTTTTLVMQ